METIIGVIDLPRDVCKNNLPKLPTAGDHKKQLRRQEAGTIRSIPTSLLQLRRMPGELKLDAPPAFLALCDMGQSAMETASVSPELKEVLMHVGTLLRCSGNSHTAPNERVQLMVAAKYMVQPLPPAPMATLSRRSEIRG